jgi:hypothetical protein
VAFGGPAALKPQRRIENAHAVAVTAPYPVRWPDGEHFCLNYLILFLKNIFK